MKPSIKAFIFCIAAYFISVPAISHGDDLIEKPILEANKNERVWLLRTDLSVQGNVVEWADKAGWTIHWRSRTDFPVRAKKEFVGEFEGKTGVLWSLLNNLYFDHSKVNLNVKFFRDSKVVVIEDGGYQIKTKGSR